LAAKNNGLIDAIRPEIEALHKAGFRAREALVKEILLGAGED
jgi:predicted nucleic acid-binding protein